MSIKKLLWKIRHLLLLLFSRKKRWRWVKVAAWVCKSHGYFPQDFVECFRIFFIEHHICNPFLPMLSFYKMETLAKKGLICKHFVNLVDLQYSVKNFGSISLVSNLFSLLTNWLWTLVLIMISAGNQNFLSSGSQEQSYSYDQVKLFMGYKRGKLKSSKNLHFFSCFLFIQKPSSRGVLVRTCSENRQ